MGDFLEVFREVQRQKSTGSFSQTPAVESSVTPATGGLAVPAYEDPREQAIIDSRLKDTGSSFLDLYSLSQREKQVNQRRQQRAYAEQAPPEAVAPVKELLSSSGDRAKVLDIVRKMTPGQKEESLRLAAGIAQQMGDDRGGAIGRTLGALSLGVSKGVSQPIMELIGMGGTQEEIDYIRKLDAIAGQEFAPARPGDPWYESGPLQAAQMAPWMATVVGGNVAGTAAGKIGGQLLARGAAAGVPGAKAAFQAAGAVGRAPTLLGRQAMTTRGVLEGAGGLAGITAASFPGQYAQEVDSLKELGMQDDWKLRLLAGGTATVGGLIEGIVPNPFAGSVSLKQGAMKAARQYLWEAIKKAPGELTEEGLQGFTSGLGDYVAQYIASEKDLDFGDGETVKSNGVKKKTIVDAFKKGWEQTKEAALPMAFLLGAPAVGGAGLSAIRARRYQLEQIQAKGFVSESDAKEVGIDGASRRDRMANLEAERQDLDRQEQELVAQSDQEFIQQQQAGGMQVDESGQFVPQVSQADLDREFARRMASQGGNVSTPAPTDTATVPPQPQAGVWKRPLSDNVQVDQQEAALAQTQAQQAGYETSEIGTFEENGVSSIGFSYTPRAVPAQPQSSQPAPVQPQAQPIAPGSPPMASLQALTVPPGQVSPSQSSQPEVGSAAIESTNPFEMSSPQATQPQQPATAQPPVAQPQVPPAAPTVQPPQAPTVAQQTSLLDTLLSEQDDNKRQAAIRSFGLKKHNIATRTLSDGDRVYDPWSNKTGSVSLGVAPNGMALMRLTLDDGTTQSYSNMNWLLKESDLTQPLSSSVAPQKAPSVPQQTPASFAARMARGEQLTSPEDQQYRINNAAEIETELQKLAQPTGSPALTPEQQVESDRQFAEQKPAQVEAPEVPVAEARPQIKKGKKPQPKEIGVNDQGQTVFEDENGVRSVLEGDISTTEPVTMRPTRDRGVVPVVDLSKREDRFKLASEKPSTEQPTPAPEQAEEQKAAVEPEAAAASTSKKSASQTYLEELDNKELAALAKTVGVKLAGRNLVDQEEKASVVSDLLKNEKIAAFLERAVAKAKAEKPSKKKPSSKKRKAAKQTGKGIPQKMQTAKTVEVPSGDFNANERKQEGILKRLGIRLRITKNGDTGLPASFNPETKTVSIDRDYVEKWDRIWKRSGKSDEAMTWGLFSHEMFHAIKDLAPKTWNRLYNWVSDNDPVGLAEAKVAYLADMKKVDIGYYNRLLKDEDLLNDEGLSRYLEDRAGSFKFWNKLGEGDPGLLARVGRWIRKVLGFADPDAVKPNTLAGQTLAAIESAMKKHSVAMRGEGGRRASPERNVFDATKVDVAEIRAKDRPGKRVSKGLAVKSLKGVKVYEETDDLSFDYVKKNAPGVFIKNANLLADYPLVRGKRDFAKASTVEQAQEIYDVFVREVADNLNYLYSKYDSKLRVLSTLWYDGANAIANRLAKRYEVSPEQVAGIIAAMSPQKDWYQNVRLAELVLEAFNLNPVMTEEMIAYQRDVVRVDGLKEYTGKVRRAEGALAKLNLEYKATTLENYRKVESVLSSMPNLQRGGLTSAESQKFALQAGVSLKKATGQVKSKMSPDEKAALQKLLNWAIATYNEGATSSPGKTLSDSDIKKLVSKRRKEIKSAIDGSAASLEFAKGKLKNATDKSNALVSKLENHIGQTLDSVPEQIQAYMVRLYHEVNTTKDYDVIAPDGSFVEIAKNDSGENSRLAWGSFGEIGKGVSIRNNGSQKNITRRLGQQHKIRNFYNNIIDPMSKDGDVTMDTHAIAAALLMALSGKSAQVTQNFGGSGAKNKGAFGIKGLYYAFAEAYNVSAKENGILPRQMQSATWDPVRGLFTDVFKSSKANVAAVNAIWERYANGEITIDEARRQVFETAGGIDTPTWARPVRDDVGGSVREKSNRAGVRRNGQGSVGPAAGRGGRGDGGRRASPRRNGKDATTAIRGRVGSDGRVWGRSSDRRKVGGYDLAARYVADAPEWVEAGVATPAFVELKSSEKSAKQFADAITAARDSQGKLGASFYVYPEEDYRDMRLFLTEDGKAGFALKDTGEPGITDIVSVFNTAGGSHRGVSYSMIRLAIEEGGNTLDAFDTFLPGVYSANGFRAISRIKWDDDFALEGWDKEAYSDFNNGEPDVVFMAYDPQQTEIYRTDSGEGDVFAAYDEAVASQRSVAKQNYSDSEERKKQNAKAKRSGRRAPVGKGDEDLRGDSGQDRPVPARGVRSESPSYGNPREGAVSYVGRHYSTNPQVSLNGKVYGTGVSRFRGGESKRLRQSEDDRIKNRVYFYIDTAGEIKPEMGVGEYAHEVKLNNLYDPASKLIDYPGSDNDFESAVIDAGFDGYVAKPYGMAVLLGPQHEAVPVRRATEYDIGQAALKNKEISDETQVSDREVRRAAPRRPESTGDGKGRKGIGKTTPLAGSPSVPGIHGPDERVLRVAERYAKENGIDLKRQAEYVDVDEVRGKRLADAYEQMAHNPQDPDVKEAYQELIKQTTAQYKALEDAGYKFWFINFDVPNNAEYASSPYNALRDLRQNQQMGVFPTTDGFGTSDLDVNDNPLLADTGIMWPTGGLDGEMKPVLANDLFRAVHDVFGHSLEGAGFRARGEENAWQAHIRLFTGSAQGAITSETRGQNSWLNYGPYGEKNRNAKVEDTIFADQKTGLMPEWTWTEGRAADMESEVESEPSQYDLKAPDINPGVRYAAPRADVVKQLNSGEKLTLYRAMYLIDGKLYPPMSSRVKGDDQKLGMRPAEPIGEWMQSEERPDLVPKTGRNAGMFPLQKPKGTTWALYAPYFHGSPVPLNDQFTASWKNDGVKRPRMVVVEVEVPVSEMTSGYQAQGSVKKVGENKWNAGVVASKLPEGRTVVLSRYLRNKRIVPDAEVAKKIADIVNPKRLSIPENVVTPQLRKELEKNGVRISPKGTKGEAIRYSPSRQTDTPAFKKWFGDSKVVDADGEPLVVYHSTVADFSVFSRRAGDVGMHFGTAGQAEDRFRLKLENDPYGPELRDVKHATMPVYLMIKNPLRLPDIGSWNKENMAYALAEVFPTRKARIQTLKSVAQVRSFLSEMGYDGIVYKNTGETRGGAEMRAAQAKAYSEMKKVFPGQSSFSKEDQQDPAYQAYSKAQKEYAAFREENSEDSYIAFRPEQIKSAIANVGTFDPKNSDIRYSPWRQTDAAYLDAVKRGDMDTAQGMLDILIEKAGEYAGGVSPVVYHGSPHADFYEFQIPSKGFNSTVFGSYEVSRNAAFFTADKEVASRYQSQGGRKGGSVRKFNVFGEMLDLRNGISDAQFNTLVENGVNSRWLSRTGASWELFDKEQDPDGTLVKALQMMRYDGAIIKDTDGESDFDSYVAFSPSQIKSADPVTYDDAGNVVPLSERFDDMRSDVRYSPGRRKKKDDILSELYEFLEKEGIAQPKKAEPRTTSIKNRKTDELRAEAGFPPRVRPEREAFESWEDEARRQYPTAKDRLQLIALAEKDPEKLGVIESAAIGQHITYLDNQREAGKDVGDELLRTIKVSESIGTEGGRFLVSRRVERFSDYSLAGLIREHIRTVGEDPTEEQMREYAELADRIKKLEAENKKLTENLAKEAIARRKAEAANKPKPKPSQPKKGTKQAVVVKKVADAFAAFQSLWGGGNRPSPGRAAGRTDNAGTFDVADPDIRYSPGRQQPTGIRSAADSVVAALREAGVSSVLELESQVQANMPNVSKEQMQVFRDAWEASTAKTKAESPVGSNPDNAALGARAKELMRVAIELGYGSEDKKWMEVVDVVHEQLSLEVPGISKYETMQAMSDYGVWRELDKAEAAVKTRAIRGKVRQSLKIEDTLKAISQSEEWLKSGVSPEEVARRLRDKGLLPKATGRERATPDSIERDLISEFNKLKKALPVPAESREGQLKSALSTAKTAANNRLEMLDKDIAALQEALNDRKQLTKPIAEKTELKPDKELADLRSQLEAKRRQRDELKAQYDKIFPTAKPKKGRKPLTDEQKLEASMKLLRRQIDAVKADVEALESGTWAPASKSPEVTSDRREELKAELASLRATQKQARQASPAYQAREEVKYWEQYRKSQERRLAFWEKRRDEAQAGRLPVPLQKRTITENEILQKNLEIEEMQYEAMIAIEKAKRATWNYGQWIGQGVLEATSLLPRTLMLGMEMSFVLRQGFFYTYSQPMKAFNALVEALPAVFSQRLALASMESLENRPNAKEYELAKVDFTRATGPQAKLEELYQSAIIKWLESTGTTLLLPLRSWAKLYAMAERGNRTFSNIMKADMYDIQKRDTLAAREFFGISTEWTESDVKETGRISNIFSGRGTGLKGGNPWLDWLFLARRWTWSRIQADFIVPFQLVTPQWIGQWNADRGMRVALAKLYIQALVGHAAKMAAAYFVYSILAGDDEEEKPTIEFDLRSSDALALKIRETRFKDEGGLMPAIVLASRIMTGTIKTGTGEIKSIYGEDVQYGGQTAADFLINYGRYKLGTAPSAILEWISGRDAVGNVVKKSDIITSRITPLTYREIYAAESELGLKRGTLAALEAFFGVSVSTHGSRTKYKKASEAEQKKLFEQDVKRMEWDTPDFAYKDLLTESQVKRMVEQREIKKQSVVYSALANPQRKKHKSDESFQQSEKERDEAVAKLRKMGVDYNEARLLLLAYYKRQYGSAYEMRGGSYLPRESFTQRLRLLRKSLEQK